ncbi:hypothetical protein [Mesorhizobium sp. SARCC-RB16n]|uniref:hypothetical protein n=1 Tax=Mesorhizobium sp. SARCC-RB16n TaxID=2116687 RepID=UPI001FEFD44A|nr:hypothetical protein [Mesorhizobium sp. SARCC-RB16n]
MGKKVKNKAKRVIEIPMEGELETEAAYYARKCGITTGEAAKIIRQALAPKLTIVPRGS